MVRNEEEMPPSAPATIQPDAHLKAEAGDLDEMEHCWQVS
jgi:hypothetical protein